ncbi:hypothetical protein DICVIV_04741 [Dictyocaulus viviparus]|uniref:Uncharacterized protein n=1 Tax=Dictyocaulus viviparus TaxID=29172 RepID=A0A0D8Y3F0_DICVI|nr:hypothetical protein DICVIV_04741 [Dictyocaulus viviparus]
MADEQMTSENEVMNNTSYHDYHQQQQRGISLSRAGLQNEPSVCVMRDDIQLPLSTLQQNLIQGNTLVRNFFNVLKEKDCLFEKPHGQEFEKT